MDLNALLDVIGQTGARLVAVSKTHPAERLQRVYDLGIRDFGENKVQELVAKAPLLPQDIRWHLIGHLQTNKVKAVAPFVYMIHTVDSLHLVQEIEKQAARLDRTIRILFQYHIASEESKSGISPLDDAWIGKADFRQEFPHILPCGVMGMATFTEDIGMVRREFRSLVQIFHRLKSSVFAEWPSFAEVSMGMSSDYRIALEEGATIVRVGSLIFGERE